MTGATIDRAAYDAEIARAMSERELSDHVVAWARWRRWLVYRTHDSRHSPAGFPDLTLVRLGSQVGRLVFVELKSERGRVRAAQAEWIEHLDCVPGVEVYLWTPASWLSGEVERVLASEGAA